MRGDAERKRIEFKIHAYQIYLESNTLDFEKRMVAKLLVPYFLDEKYPNSGPLNISKEELQKLLSWLNPEEFSKIGMDTIKKNMDIHYKMMEFLNKNKQDDEDSEAYYNILTHLISNRSYRFWENLGYKGKPDKKKAIAEFYPSLADLIAKDTDNKLGTCFRGKLSIIAGADNFVCAHCSDSDYPCIAKLRYTGNKDIVHKMDAAFVDKILTEREYFICRTVCLYFLLFSGDIQKTSVVLGLSEDILSKYLRKLQLI